MKSWKNRIFCEDISLKTVAQSVLVCGWVDAIRDHGLILFIHIRDRTGILQLVFDSETQPEQGSYHQAKTLRNEDCISIIGIVKERSDDAKNPNISSGDLEIFVEKLDILNRSQTPPFPISHKLSIETANDPSNSFNVDEDLRLQYRYLDIRRHTMQKSLLYRHKLISCMRSYLDKHGFIDIETPVLTKSTPEGARDYLVPSRVHPHKFYALPQSPQLFKQLLMIGGMERYYQIVKCFRDEDLRPNRQPEFTQLDIEGSFIDESFIYNLIEGLIEALFSIKDINLKGPFPKISYTEAINRYGTDRPDLRFDMPLIDVTHSLKDIQFKVFRNVIDKGGIINLINIKGQAPQLSKTLLQEEFAKKIIPTMGGKGLAWMKMIDKELQSNITQFFSKNELDTLIKQAQAENDDVLVFIADPNPKIVKNVLGRFRLFIAERQNMIPKNLFSACWITDFPLFERDDNGRISSVHHPFTAANQPLSANYTPDELLSIKARAYDLVINGDEMGGGSIRIHDPEEQKQTLKYLGLSKEDGGKFNWFNQALSYGAPPHGGIALGVDRIVSTILNSSSIREVIAFPKNRVAGCPLTKAPNHVDNEQLDDLHIHLTKLEKDMPS